MNDSEIGLQPRSDGAAAGRTRLNSAAIRRLNTARIFHALREHPSSSRRALAAHGLPVMLEDASILVSPFGTQAVPMGGAALALEAFQPMAQDFQSAG